jgi:hypothetical protein
MTPMKPRASLHGIGPDSKDIINGVTKKPETVYFFTTPS